MRESDPLGEANAKIEQLENTAVNEIKNYANDVKQTKIDLFDNKPFVPKLLFLVASFFSFLMGISLYFLFKDDDKFKWSCPYFLFGSIAGAIYALVKFCFF